MERNLIHQETVENHLYLLLVKEKWSKVGMKVWHRWKLGKELNWHVVQIMHMVLMATHQLSQKMLHWFSMLNYWRLTKQLLIAVFICWYMNSWGWQFSCDSMSYWKSYGNHDSFFQFIIPRQNKMLGLGQKHNEICKANYADIYLTSKRNKFTVTVIANE